MEYCRFAIKNTLLVISTCLAIIAGAPDAMAQYRWDVGGSIGSGNYLGDIGGKELTRRNLFLDLHLNQTRYSVHTFARYRFNNIISAVGRFGVVAIADADGYSIHRDRVARNTHFRNKIIESSLLVQAVFLSRPSIMPFKFRKSISGEVYAISGVSYFKHNPQARITRAAAEYQFAEGYISTKPSEFDYDNWYDLREYSTEGITYSKTSFSVPIGIGGGVTIDHDLKISLELIWSVTFTDYLDDVSTTYADPENLDEIGRLLSSPTYLDLIYNILDDGQEGYILNHQFSDNYTSPRGNSSRNDSYGTLQVSISKVIRPHSMFSKRNYGQSRKTDWKAPKRNKKPRGYNRKGKARF